MTQCNPQEKTHLTWVADREKLEEKLAAYGRYIESGGRLFGEEVYNDFEQANDDDADCNYYNCC